MKSRVSAKGQIVIPVALRRKYGIKSGTKIIIADVENGIVRKPVNEQYFKNLQGSLKGKGELKVLLDDHHHDKRNQ